MIISLINNICSKCQEVILVKSETKDLILFEPARLTQDLPLLIILFLCFNSNLVQALINENKDLITYIDDHNAWVTRDSIVQNIKNLRFSVILHSKN